MIHIKALFKAVALFCLSTVLCQGCGLFSKKDSMPKNSEVLSKLKELEEKAAQIKQYDLKEREKDAAQIRKDRFLEERGEDIPTSEMEYDPIDKKKEILDQSGLSSGSIKLVEKLFNNASYSTQCQLQDLSTEKFQSLLDLLEKQEALYNDFYDNLTRLLIAVSSSKEFTWPQIAKSAKTLYRLMQVRFVACSPEEQQVFQSHLKDLLSILQSSINPWSTIHSLKTEKELGEDFLETFKQLVKTLVSSATTSGDFRVVEQMQDAADTLYEVMQEVFTACSPEEEQALQSHLKEYFSILHNSLEVYKACMKIMPNALVKEMPAFISEWACQCLLY